MVELQTNFGGGKTHSMLALYHLFGEAQTSTLPGLEKILECVGLQKAPVAQRAVLVGTHIGVGQATKKPDGTVVRTLWGEMAWQLGRREGFCMVAESDERGTSPGANEVLDHLSSLPGAQVEIRLEIQVGVGLGRGDGQSQAPAGTGSGLPAPTADHAYTPISRACLAASSALWCAPMLGVPAAERCRGGLRVYPLNLIRLIPA